jgi:hypothetical protein
VVVHSLRRVVVVLAVLGVVARVPVVALLVINA